MAATRETMAIKTFSYSRGLLWLSVLLQVLAADLSMILIHFYEGSEFTIELPFKI